ncbi:DUF4388 domain-containing protein [Collimonas sp. OK412]|jgi:hypothetical protein|uniref:DUF4388 domain-containing protein n=1 Tax=Collimonas sp. (strain OK412) TaxID=1801619 RepID=UPI0008E56677|nr:DUF4388 domain-containing protein [Collimonas sp. OK412]SFD22719.1 hypothetical protein SAMN04515619_13127 [Collimonas sp. OK412]
MAIWGRLSDFSLHAVLTSLREYRSGIIHIDAGDGNQYCLHVSEQALTALQINADNFSCPEQVKAVMAKLFSSSTGTFRYLSAHTSPLRRDFQLDLNDLDNTGNISSQDEISSQKPPLLSVFEHRGMKKLLPHADTRFTLNLKDQVMDNYVLQRFLDRSTAQLMTGVSASELAKLLNEDVEKIRFYFYRLIQMTVIIPTCS